MAHNVVGRKLQTGSIALQDHNFTNLLLWGVSTYFRFAIYRIAVYVDMDYFFFFKQSF